MTLKSGPRSQKSNQLVPPPPPPPPQQCICASLVKIGPSVQKITRGNEATWTPTPTGSAPKTICPPPSVGGDIIIKSRQSSNFGQIRKWTAKLAALERLEKPPSTYNGRYVVATLDIAFIFDLIVFILQVMKTCINFRMSLNFCQIPPLTMEFSALECLVATLAPPFLIGFSS